MRKLIAICIFVMSALPLAAQTPPPALKLPRVSQHEVITQTVGLTDITVDYSRPAVKGRAIWGALVPYDKVWRTGANEATQISFSDDVTIDGKPLPKGTYSLHTIPGKDSWTIIFNKTAKQWGSFNYKQEDDALRVTVKPVKANFMELLTINFPSVTNDNATVVIRWENVSVPFTVGTNTTAKVMADANAAVAAAAATDFQTPYRAAGFAFDAGNNDQATKWVDQSLKVKQTMGNLYLKARIQAKNGDKAGAIATGESALKLAGPNDKELASEIQDSINDWKK
ncbi:MAG: DUF2911 domain-containing protein [Acidobacteria bacterium]|nr:DUF2911 domain-containing protein [Acidobacteriota bacterium]MBV9069379.1 DUF2911 domain-containing protein [Acidobacteriota bacterium]MBV9185715.1 DUF2911 domain-containing protein [Acidobacteriota bacterium]